MCAYAPFCDQETFELRMYLCNFAVCHASQRLSAATGVCIPPIVLGYWPCRPRMRACVCVRHIDPYAETMVWDKFHDGYQPVVLPFILCICQSFLEATIRKNQIHTHAYECACGCLSLAQGASHDLPVLWVAATVRTRCGLSNCAAKLLFLLLLSLLENE